LSVIQEVQRNPISNQILHLDLYEVSADETMDVSVNVHAIGSAYGVRNEGGVTEIVSHELHIRCLPGNLPEYIEVDVTDMHVNETLHVSELAPIEGVEFLDDPDQPVITCVHAAVAEEEPEKVEEAEGAVAEVAEEGAVESEEGEKEESA
jgi:large subunit ribosomal protein L25